MEDAECFLAGQQGLVLGAPGQWVQRAIVNCADATVLGDCAARVRVDQPRTAEIGITLARASQGRGVAAEALRGLLGALFDQHGMHRVMAEADDHNRPVRQLLERVGLEAPESAVIVSVVAFG
jgi:RimJ/RimL family protein N-acetyltransferase